MATDTPEEAPAVTAAEAPVPEETVVTATAVDDRPTDQELLDAAPPLILPGGMKLEFQCPGCGLRFDPAPDENIHGQKCPNCGSVIP